jgi:hypothetical protein
MEVRGNGSVACTSLREPENPACQEDEGRPCSRPAGVQADSRLHREGGGAKRAADLAAADEGQRSGSRQLREPGRQHNFHCLNLYYTLQSLTLLCPCCNFEPPGKPCARLQQRCVVLQLNLDCRHSFGQLGQRLCASATFVGSLQLPYACDAASDLLIHRYAISEI